MATDVVLLPSRLVARARHPPQGRPQLASRRRDRPHDHVATPLSSDHQSLTDGDNDLASGALVLHERMGFGHLVEGEDVLDAREVRADRPESRGDL